MIAEGRGASLLLPAPAKLNLFLHVTGRRADGYHELQTVFQLLDWGDEIELNRREDGRIERVAGADGVAAAEDLAVRAAQALAAAAGDVPGVDITVRKRIPVGAGLGGGSSDAATVLVGLNRLWQLGLDRGRLIELGRSLGADVPVFVNGRSAFAEGIGDRLQPLDLPEGWFVVLWPGVGVATASIFQAPELTRNTPPLKIAALPGAATRNDLQPIAIRQQPVIADALAWLSDYGEARMSGSGSSVFVPAADQDRAQAIASASPWPAWAVRGTQVSPLHRVLGLPA